MNTRVPANRRYQPTEYEHAANCATHALWIVPSILGSFILCCLSDDQWEMISAWIYGFGLCGLFIVSTVFHTISWKKRHLRTSKKSGPRFEHKKTMTPTHPPLCHPSPGTESASINLTTRFGIAKLMLRELGPWTSHMRWIIWIMACVGTIYVFLFHERYKIVELICYSVMCTFPALVVLSMTNTEGLFEMLMGGLFYCLGMVFFKSDGRIPFAHAIWHLFVSIGAGVHYYAIWKYLYHPAMLAIRTSK
ncbi:monocyte to macrophage differentiation factor 2 isoform X2 [Callorhinchus milii]|nr:monocyte to macrophage differentiation factor 2 isoform X2 [Callorhinchus milii]|eukprot:gi/632975623/ref/XP_007904329.1/ PREDICTED: monocyte to macrophage differentiation factor 2 isoform X2 [Callorhinchus milii]